MSTVRDEIRQARPFASLTDEGVVTLLRTTDGVRRALSEVVARRGITLQQYNVLRILRGAGAEGLPTLDIARRMIETAPGITRLLERLEGRGLVRRHRCPRDSRRVLCFATRKALAALAALDRPLSEVGDRVLGPLGEDRTRELIQLLDTVRVAARNQTEPATSPQQKQKQQKQQQQKKKKKKKRQGDSPMKTSFAVLAAAILAVASPALAGETYAVDTSHASVSFQIRHFMSQVAGRFNAFQGSISIDRENPAASAVRFSIEAASIDTGDQKRDEHLRSADFFDVANNPDITFESTAVKPVGDDTYEVTGHFTMNGVTRQVTLPVKVLGEIKDPWGNQRIGFEVATTLNRKDYGIIWNQALDSGGFLLSDEVKVAINLEAVEKKQRAD